jgi:23S rRNA pseudouridine2605 synthase
MLERLQKIIARAGIASRRHAEELIRSGQVRVNGVVVTELGAKADPEHDHVEAAGRPAEQPTAASYFILNKPPHVVSTMADPQGRATLRHVLRGLTGGVFPVGRLDYAASGLILLTSDGKLADSIFKISSSLLQVYWMKLSGRPTAETLSKVGHEAQARLRLLRAPGASAGHVENPWYEAELRGARRDLLRQAFLAAEHPVEKMKRVRLGPLDLGDLEEGHYRQLAPSEVALLRRAVEQATEQGASQVAFRPATRPSQKKRWRPKGGPGRPVQQGGRQGLDHDAVRHVGRDKAAPFVPNVPGGVSRDAGRPFQPTADRGAARGAGKWLGRNKFAPVAPEQGAPSKREWGARRPSQPGAKHGGERGPGEWAGRGKFVPGTKGAPKRGSTGSGRPLPPGSERSGGRESGKWAGRDKFVPAAPGQGASGKREWGAGRPSQTGSERSGERGAGRWAGRNKFVPGTTGAPSGGGTGGGRPFQPSGERRFGRGPGQSGRPSNRPGGDRSEDRSKSQGKFMPGAPRQGGPGAGKFRGKRPPGRPSVPPGKKP